MSGEKIRIVLIEDQAIVRESLAHLLNAQEDMTVVGQDGSAANAAALCAAHAPDLVLMDVVTDGGESGIAAAAGLKEDDSDLCIILMTSMPDITFVDEARQVGVDSFIYKNMGSEMLCAAIRGVMNGYHTFPASTVPPELPDGLSLTEREVQVLRGVCEAKSRKEIADEMYLSEGTVKNIITTILNKTGYESITKLAIVVLSKGYITLMK
ncbi:MAG: response regulator transcription factor [Clostridiales Family XIII bacterium]|nr:response regulator transcription factor [Clostridiales Family XIII bacterium]